MMENDKENTVTKELVIGEFKTGKKFLSFVSAFSQSRIRLLRDSAFIDGKSLSGTLEGVRFKLTICSENTVNFEEVDTNKTDTEQKKRLLQDIESMSVSGYAQKFIISGLTFTDVDGKICYLEVEHKKPIDVLRSFFEEIDTDENADNKEVIEVSERSMSLLDSLLSNSNKEDEDQVVEELQEGEDQVVEKSKSSFMEEAFNRMNEEKINELKGRVESKRKEIYNYNITLNQTETSLTKSKEELGILETRLSSMFPNEESNGYVFYISEEQKYETGLDESTRSIADKIADVMKLKKEVLFNLLTNGFYNIKITKKDDLKNKIENYDLDILNKINSIDAFGKFTITDTHIEYRGDLNWHQLTSKMIKFGFEQEPEFDKLCQSNSYESHEEVKENKMIDNIDSEKVKPSTVIESKVIKTFDEPTTLVVVGTVDNNENRDIEITDDYTSFGLYIGDKKVKNNYDSDGFISIMTIPDFKKWQSKYPDALLDGFGVDSFLIPNFKGSIAVTAMVDGEFTKEFDISDYIQHQLEDADVFLVLPEGTQILKMDDYHKIPTSELRDLKIEDIIK